MKRLIFLFLIILTACNSVKQKEQTIENLYDYDIEQRLDSLGITLKVPTLPKGINIALAVKTGNLIYLSGNGPRTNDGVRITGKVGTDLTVEEGYDAARITAINHIAILKSEIGDLNKVVRIVKVLGMVNADSSFTQQPAVINGYTDLMVEVFGERGRHARSAVGMASLPFNLACEVEAIVQVQE
jgi:enamine deaminase RidA (YjgF/YER057c/UK114 family)